MNSSLSTARRQRSGIAPLFTRTPMWKRLVAAAQRCRGRLNIGESDRFRPRATTRHAELVLSSYLLRNTRKRSQLAGCASTCSLHDTGSSEASGGPIFCQTI